MCVCIYIPLACIVGVGVSRRAPTSLATVFRRKLPRPVTSWGTCYKLGFGRESRRIQSRQKRPPSVRSLAKWDPRVSGLTVWVGWGSWFGV